MRRLDARLEAERTRALLAGYHAMRRLLRWSVPGGRVMLRAAALRFWLSRLQTISTSLARGMWCTPTTRGTFSPPPDAAGGRPNARAPGWID